MAAIIQLDTVRLTRHERLTSLNTREAITAEIILFPGVRYERWSDEEDCVPIDETSGKRKKKSGA